MLIKTFIAATSALLFSSIAVTAQTGKVLQLLFFYFCNTLVYIDFFSLFFLVDHNKKQSKVLVLVVHTPQMQHAQYVL